MVLHSAKRIVIKISSHRQFFREATFEMIKLFPHLSR